MRIYKTVSALKNRLSLLKKEGMSVGFVPTMGALHQGHLSLMKKAKQENDILVVSIFVNPLQFDNKEDLVKYPNSLKKDIKLLKSINCDLLFIPSVKQMYPKPDKTIYDFGHLNKVMEGKFRPGHFNGVAVVVDKLFSFVQPHIAYFGQKDYQQLLIIKEMVKQKNHKVKVIGCPIIRENDGLAMSSRNRRLTKEERKQAPFIRQCMLEMKKKAKKESMEEVKKWIQKKFNNNTYFDLEYFEISDANNLKPLLKWKKAGNNVACITAYNGEIRLIDNIIF